MPIFFADPQRRVLQGNGFYLNSLPPLNHYGCIENENMSSERKLESQRHAFSLHLSLRQGHRLSQVPSPMERHIWPSKNEGFT